MNIKKHNKNIKDISETINKLLIEKKDYYPDTSSGALEKQFLNKLDNTVEKIAGNLRKTREINQQTQKAGTNTSINGEIWEQMGGKNKQLTIKFDHPIVIKVPPQPDVYINAGNEYKFRSISFGKHAAIVFKGKNHGTNGKYVLISFDASSQINEPNKGSISLCTNDKCDTRGAPEDWQGQIRSIG
jgi:hypothetical protein